LRPLIRLALLISSFSALSPVGAASPRPDHPLLGTWQLALNNGSCVETSEFRDDGTLHVASAASRNVSEFVVEDDPPGDGHYILRITLASSNGAPDCIGLITPVGTTATVNIRLVASDRFIMCVDPMHHTCLGPYKRLTRPPNNRTSGP
jgi:hypothetical protein